jgi:hypothetical protein
MEAGRVGARRALTVPGDLAEAPVVGAAAARGVGVGVRRHCAAAAGDAALGLGPAAARSTHAEDAARRGIGRRTALAACGRPA